MGALGVAVDEVEAQRLWEERGEGGLEEEAGHVREEQPAPVRAAQPVRDADEEEEPEHPRVRDVRAHLRPRRRRRVLGRQEEEGVLGAGDADAAHAAQNEKRAEARREEGADPAHLRDEQRHDDRRPAAPPVRQRRPRQHAQRVAGEEARGHETALGGGEVPVDERQQKDGLQHVNRARRRAQPDPQHEAPLVDGPAAGALERLVDRERWGKAVEGRAREVLWRCPKR